MKDERTNFLGHGDPSRLDRAWLRAKEFKPFQLSVETRREGLILKTALALYPSSAESQALYSKILEGLGEIKLKEQDDE